MSERAIMAILRHAEEHLFEPSQKWPRYEHEERSYSRWAAYEIIQLLMDRPLEDPRILIEGFMLQMISFSQRYDPRDGCNMFTVAADTANDILQII